MIPTKQTNKDKYNHMCDNEEDHEQGDFHLYLVVSDEDLELIGDAIICGSIRRLQSMLLKLHRLKTEFDKDLISFSGLRWRVSFQY